MKREIWKDIQGYDGLYRINNFGVIKNRKNETIKQFINKQGYYFIILSKNGLRKNITIHRLLCIHFVENKFNKSQVNHIDGNKLNNSIENLEWCTAKENMVHARKIGLNVSKKGEKHHLFGMTDGKNNSAKIILDTNTGVYYESVREAARLLGFNYTTLCHKLCGQNKNKTSLIYV